MIRFLSLRHCLPLLACAACAANESATMPSQPSIVATIVSIASDSASRYNVGYRLTAEGPANAVLDLCGTRVQRLTSAGWVGLDKGQCATGGYLLQSGRSILLFQLASLGRGDTIRVVPVFGPDGTGVMYPDSYRAGSPSAFSVVDPL